MGKNARIRKEAKVALKEQRKAEGLAKASAKNVRMSPRKARIVIDLIRGKELQDAINILSFTSKMAADPIRKVVESAAANAENNYNLDRDRLYVKSCYVDNGFMFKRMHPTTQGRARIVKKRTSHITIELAEARGAGGNN